MVNGFWLSNDLIAQLQIDEARRFRRGCAQNCEKVYQFVVADKSNEMKGLLRLDAHTYYTAITSAYIDLKRDEVFHAHDKGPSFLKVGAAMTAWLNRFRPIHFRENIPPQTFDLGFLNSGYALWVGWHTVNALREQDGQPHQRTSELFATMQTHGKEVRQIIYHLHYRIPRFHELALLFQFVPFL